MKPCSVIAVCVVLAVGAVGRAQCASSRDVTIEAARAEATAFTKSLPDYAAYRITIRFSGTRVRTLPGVLDNPNLNLSEIVWNRLNTVAADLVVVAGKEVYSNVKVDNQPAKSPAVTGSWSTGEFSGMLDGLFAKNSAALFSNQRRETIGKRPVLRYRFAVDHAHSQWVINGKTGSWATAYTGDVWIDRETGKTLRIEMSARELPNSVSLEAIESSVEYSFVQIAGREYVLPIHTVVVSCETGGVTCVKNDTLYRNYDKFDATSSISFQ